MSDFWKIILKLCAIPSFYGNPIFNDVLETKNNQNRKLLQQIYEERQFNGLLLAYNPDLLKGAPNIETL